MATRDIGCDSVECDCDRCLSSGLDPGEWDHDGLDLEIGTRVTERDQAEVLDRGADRAEVAGAVGRHAAARPGTVAAANQTDRSLSGRMPYAADTAPSRSALGRVSPASQLHTVA